MDQSVRHPPRSTVHLNDHLTAPFYHLEAVKVEKMDQPGIGTITD